MAKLDGVTDITPDTKALTCSFKVPKSNTDYEAKLAEFAKTNDHLEGFKIQ